MEGATNDLAMDNGECSQATVVMDVENVLTSFGPWRSWLQNELSSVDLGPRNFVALWQDSGLARRAQAGTLPVWQAWREFFHQIGVDPGWSEELALALRSRMQRGMAECRLSPEAIALLQELGPIGVRFAVLAIAPWTQDELDAVLARLQLPVAVHHKTTTACLGVSGSDARLFDRLLPPNPIQERKAVFLSCDPGSLRAAQRAGVLAVQLGGVPGPTADLYVPELAAAGRFLRSRLSRDCEQPRSMPNRASVRRVA